MWTWLNRAAEWFSNTLNRVFGREEVQEIAQGRNERALPAVNALASSLASNALSVGDWERQMRETIKQQYIQQYLLGRGGLGNMTQADWGRIGGMLAEQYRYLGSFAREIAAGNLSEAQIAVRAQMYIDSASEAYWRATGQAQGWPSLPAYPGDGSTTCLTRCLCSWNVVEGDGEWECYWMLGVAEHCPDCLDRAARWNPLRVAM